MQDMVSFAVLLSLGCINGLGHAVHAIRAGIIRVHVLILNYNYNAQQRTPDSSRCVVYHTSTFLFKIVSEH